MNPIEVKPVGTTHYRYRPDELSGPLPQTLFKVLPEKYAKRFVEHGELMWSTLAWFQNEEDSSRRDEGEGARRFFPVTGLAINRLEHDARPDDSKFLLDGHGFVSKAAESHRIFIYSMTLDPNLAIGDATKRRTVEVFDPPEFVRRVQAAVSKHRRAREDTFIHDVVRYWSASNPPEEVWALPHKLTMYKEAVFEQQQEYRLAFGIRPSVFDFENVQCFIVNRATQWPETVLDPNAHRIKLRLGRLSDCCRLQPETP